MPNPEDDEVVAVFYSVQDSDRDANDDGSVRSGVIVVQTDQLNGRRVRNLKAEFVESELELLNRFIDVVVEIDQSWPVTRYMITFDANRPAQ